MPSLDDLLRHALPGEAEVLVGAPHLARPITWVVRVRARAPALPPLSGGELILASTAAIDSLDARPSLAQVIDQVAHLGAAAVLVTGRVDAAAERAAERCDLPLIVLRAPLRLRPEALELELQHWLVQRKVEAQRELSSLQRELTGLALAGGFAALLERTTRVTGKSTVLLAPDGALRLRRQPSAGALALELVDAVLAVGRPTVEKLASVRIEEADEPRVTRVEVPDLGLLQLVAGVQDGIGTGAYLSLVGRLGEVDERDADALLAAAGAGSIELVREHASEAARVAVEGDVLDRLSEGSIEPADALRRRARRLGHDLDQLHVAIAVRSEVADDELVCASLLRLAALAPALIGRRGMHILALLPCPAKAEAELPSEDVPPRSGSDFDALRRVRDWHVQAARTLGPLGVGSSGPAAGVRDLARALSEARQALELGERLLGPGKLVSFADLGIFSFLLRSQAPQALRDFHAQTLGRLVAYDTARGAELLPTLEAYFASRCSPDATAKRLHLHRNSLLYRLRRIEEIAGVQLQDPETRLQLHLALRVGQILAVPAS